MREISKNSSKKNTSNEVISKFKNEIKDLETIEKLVEFSFSFKFKDISIAPIQRRIEIIQLLKILKKKEPKTIGEIGTARGGTLFLLCQTVSDNAKIISVDFPDGPFGGEDYQKWKIPFYQSFAKKNQELKLIVGDSHLPKTFEKVKEFLGGEKFDFLLIDGDHTYNGVKQDFDTYKKLVKNNGIIAFHDINPGPEKYVGGVPKFWNEIKEKFVCTEIIDEKNKDSYGIGLILNQLEKELKNNESLKNFYDIAKLENFNVGKKVENDIRNLEKYTLSTLFYEYSQRTDLQEKYPEVKEGDLRGLLEWAVKYGIKERRDVFEEYENSLNYILKKIVAKNNELEKIDTELRNAKDQIVAKTEELEKTNTELRNAKEEAKKIDTELRNAKEEANAKNDELEKIISNPLGALFYEYLQRTDLQEKYPEVKDGELRGLLEWAVKYGIKERRDVFREHIDKIVITFEKLDKMEKSIEEIEKSKIFKMLRKFDNIKKKKKENLKNSDLLCHIDGDWIKKEKKSDFMIIKGWCFHKKLKIKNIFLTYQGQKKKITNFAIPRFDVFNAHMHPNSINSGFWVTWGIKNGIEVNDLSLEIIYENNQKQSVKILEMN